jgi:hypothetical protein
MGLDQSFVVLCNKSISSCNFIILVIMMIPPKQGCHNGRFWMKITVRMSADVVRTFACVRVYPADGFLPSADAVKTASARARVPVDVDPQGPADVVRTCGRVRASTRRGSVRTRGNADVARTRVDTRCTAMGPRGRGAASARTHGHGGAEVRVSPIKDGARPLFPHFQPNPVE